MTRASAAIRYRPMRHRLSAETLESVARASTAGFGHLVEQGAISELRPLDRSLTMVGRALTVRIEGIDSAAVHAAVDLAEPGDVLMIDTQGVRDRAPVGAIIGGLLAKKAVSGVVIDGMITDVNALGSLGLPVYSRGISPLTTRLTGEGGRIGFPVRIAGVTVEPGWYVLGDADGIMVLSPEQVDGHLQEVLSQEAGEHVFFDRFEAGMPLFELSGAARSSQIITETQED